MTTENSAERALHYLIKVTTATIPYEVRGREKMCSELEIAVLEAKVAEHMRKHIWAIEAMKEEGPLGKKEIAAYASPRYKEAVYELAVTAAALEVLRGRIEAAEARIEVWRSMNANQRGPRL
jgi:hypothetical protein